jgi:transcription antitermination factor NusG
MPNELIGLPNSCQVSQPSWYAIYARHQHEKMVAQILTSKGFEVFLPLYWTVHRWKDRKKQVWLPLFPCYLFLQEGLSRQLDILKTPGVHGVVACGGRPAVIPEEEIDAIRQMVESGIRVEPHPFLKCGDRVRVKRGPLIGVEGILIRKKNQFHLVVSMEILGRSAAVEIDVSTVERVSSPRTAATSHSGLAHVSACA